MRYAPLAGYAIYAVTVLAGLMVGAAPSDGTKLDLRRFDEPRSQAGQ